MRTLPLLSPRAAAAWQPAAHAHARSHAAVMLNEPWVAPNDWLVYGHLHLILALPTITLLALSPPLSAASRLYKDACYTFIGFIVLVGVAQSFVWDVRRPAVFCARHRQPC